MTFSMILATLFEISLLALVVIGFFNEGKIAAFERRFICAIRRRRLRVIKNENPVYEKNFKIGC